MPDPVPGDTVLVDPRGARELRVIQTTWAGKITASPFRGGRHGAPETFQTHETLPVLGRQLPVAEEALDAVEVRVAPPVAE